MRIVMYNKNGYQIGVVEAALPPIIDNDRISYLEYKGVSADVFTRCERRPDGMIAEKIVAVRSGRHVEVYDELPGRLLEKLSNGTSVEHVRRIPFST